MDIEKKVTGPAISPKSGSRLQSWETVATLKPKMKNVGNILN